MSDYTDNYERFWEAYPKRNGRKVGKKPAFAQWNKLTTDQKRAAFSDVEKRNRQGTWGKYIRDAARYLRDYGWEDEIAPEQSDMYSRRVPQASEPQIEIHWADRMMNRLFINYVFATSGLHDVGPALDIKHGLLSLEVPALEGDVAAELMTKQAAATEIAELFLTRLDIEYGKAAKGRVLKIARKAA